ncbi:MAG: hypothetical protein Q9175_005609 [Cornicularia normoerica]
MGVFDSKGVRLMITKRAAATTAQCSAPYTYETLFCINGATVTRCFTENPCADDGGATLSVRNLSARELTIYLSLAAATSTPPTTRTSSAQTKKTTATLSNDLRSSSNLSTSSGQTGLTTSTTSAYAATPVAAVSSSAASGPSRSSPSSHSNTAAVAAGTAGAIIGAIIALVLMLLVLRWRKRRTEDSSWATQHDNGPRSHKNVANGARSTFQDNVGSESAPAYIDNDHNSLLYPGTNNAGSDGYATYKRSEPYSAASSSSPTQPGPEMPGLMPDPIGKQPELEVPAFHIPAELSPSPERSLINIPRRRQTADGPVMHPNLSLTGVQAGGHGAKRMGNSHVMSWMSYYGDESGPVR